MGISGTHLIADPATEFFFYAILMLVVIAVFIVIAMNYTYVAIEDLEDSSVNGGDHETNADLVVPAINVPTISEDHIDD